MELENNFHDLFFTKKGGKGIGKMLATTFVICLIMCAIECTAVYALEATRFEAHDKGQTSLTGYVGGRDYLIAIACAGPLSGILSNFIPVFGVRHVFEPAAQKNGAPNKAQKAMGFVTITFCIALAESILMSLIMYSVDTQVVVPGGMHSTGQVPEEVKHPIPGEGKYGVRVGGSALGISFGAALIVTSLVPMGMKKLFALIEKKPVVKSTVPYNETDLIGKVEYLDDEQKDTDTLRIKKANTKVRQNSKKRN